MPEKMDSRSFPGTHRLGLGIALGLALGIALIVALGDVAFIATSVGIGVTIGAGLSIGTILCEAFNGHDRGNSA